MGEEVWASVLLLCCRRWLGRVDLSSFKRLGEVISLTGGDRGMAWFELRGISGYRTLAMGLCSVSATGLNCLSSSSGGVGSSGSVDSKEVSDARESRLDTTMEVRMALGGHVGFTGFIGFGLGFVIRC